MKKILSLVVLFGLLSTAAAFAGEKFQLISADHLAQLIASHDAKLAIFDANNADTRKKDGVVPGAHLLSDYKKYDVAKELPTAKDSKLVFYCANPRCMASHEAAERAVKAGYKDVAVMSDGIQGWIKAGHPSTKVD